MCLLLTTGNFKPGVYAVSVTGRLPPGELYLTAIPNRLPKLEFLSFTFTFNLYLLFGDNLIFLHLWRCGERVEKQRSDLQIQRHSSEDINLNDTWQWDYI